jgi:hypothetical protein
MGLSCLLVAAAPAHGQSRTQRAPGQAQQPTATPASARVAVPDPLTVAKLVWTTIAAVDHANATGNYSVLRDLGAPSFQSNNNAATLAGIFQTIRTQRVDLSNALLVAPTYEIGPVMQDGLLRVRGVFPLRPTGIAFDLLFQPVQDRWALFGIAIIPSATVAPAQPSRR